jgi:KRAB domain-containing zinc finger protein
MVARESMEVLRRQKIVKTENDIDSDTDEYDNWGGALMPVPNSNRKKKKDLKKVSNLQCEICYHEARNSAELKQHVLAMHDHTMYQCTFCPFKTSHQSSLKRHKQTVHPLAELKVYCDTCINTGAQMPPKAENKEELRRILELADALQCQDCKNVSRRSLELIKFHEENPKSQGQDQIISIQKGRLACDMCGYDGRNFNDLKQHKLTVHEGVSYNCELCDYVAARPEALKRHRKTRHEERKFMCDHCNFRAHTAVKLSQHKLTAHVGVRYPCNQCNYSSARPNKLKEHKLMFHNGNEGNGFQCDECNKVFPDVTMLKKHKQDHNRVTPQFQCHHCGFNTEQVQQLQNHIDTVHRRGMPGNQQCPNCQYQCMDPVELHKHMNKVHGGRRSVNLAQQGQNVQIATVTLGCEHCSFKCLSAQELQQHLEGTHNISSQAVAQSLQAAANQAALQAAVHQAAAQAVANQAAGVVQGQQNQHNQINLNVARTYSCQKCNYKVDNLENIQSHVKNQHGESDPKFIMAKGEIQFACGECNFVANTEEVLQQHKASTHENEGYPRDLSNHQVRGMNQQQAHQVRTMNVATTVAAHNRVAQHEKDKAKMFVNQQEYDQAALTGILTSSFRGQIPVANMPGGFTTYSIHTPGALPTYQIVGGQTISVPTVSAVGSQNQAALTAASAAASSSVPTLVVAAAGQHADGQASATTSNVARVSGYQWGAPNWYDPK